MPCSQNVGFLVLLAFASFTVVFGKAHLWIRFYRFDNPGGKGDNGHCCDGRVFFCPSKCDHRFIICVDQHYGRRDTSSCPYGVKRTREIKDQDSIVFGGQIGGVRNPMIFDFDSWPGAVRVKVGVWDEDDNNDDRVDFLVQDIISRPGRSFESASSQRFSVRSRVTLVMDVMVYCSPDFYGKACDVKCTPRSDRLAGYSCDRGTGRKVCREGWTGANCDVSEDDCVTNKCRHGATCVDGHRSHTCICAPGYTGQFCAHEIDECLSNPCQNNGVCIDDVNRFTCTCSREWTGVTCEVRDACKEVACANGGTCFNVNGTFACKCALGFAGPMCETDVDECQSSPCQNGATCVEEVGRFQCVCSPGWQGSLCDVDVNECDSGPCSRNALECHNLRNDFACVCSNGYTGKSCDVDIDECLKRPCQNGGICLNKEPGFVCSCPYGYYGDTCGEDVNECEASPCAAGSTCVNFLGSFDCLCPPDFTGPTCDRQIDDCEGQLCEHNGTCLDAIHDFQCVCTPQYTGRKCGVYVDRCLAEPCQNGAQCFDPGYGKPLQCRCLKGWTGPLCGLDEDECLLDPCANEAECVNTPGSFNCTCPDGWTGLLCQEDINECQLHLKQNQTLTCEDDLDECKYSTCAENASCVNTPGSFHCVCPDGWTGDNCQDDVDECQLDTFSISAVTPCPEASDESNCTEEIVGSSPRPTVPSSPCENGGVCRNSPGSFRCICRSGWTGVTCEEDVNECVVGFSGPGLFDDGLLSSPYNWTEDRFSPNTEEAEPPFSGVVNRVDSKSGGGKSSDETGNATDLTGTASDATGNASDVSGNAPGATGNVLKSSENASERTGNASDGNATDATGSSPNATGYEPVAACLHGGTCRNSPGAFRCVCPPEWAGPRCAEDVNECHRDRANPCHNDGRCLNTPGGFHCECDSLWEGTLCSVEKDMCREILCENNATCIRRRAANGGGVQCVCRRGWQGPRCLQDRDECDLDPCLNGGTCQNEMGGFRCLCPEGVVGRTCSSSSLFDEGVTFPIYLEGHFGPEEEVMVKNGVKSFLEQNGGFRHDFKVTAYLKTHALTVKEAKSPLTEVYVTVLVENVTLSADDVTEVFNRVPVRDLESYFPLPFFRQEVAEHVVAKPSAQQELDHSPPWYSVLGGMLGMLLVVFAVVVVCRKKYTFRWWPQKRSDATVIFSQNGNSHDSSSAAFDDNSMTQSQSVEYINTLPYSHSHNHHNNADTPERTAAWDSGGAFPWSPCQQETCGDSSAQGAMTSFGTMTTQDRPQSSPCPAGQARDPLQGEFPEARPRPKTEVAWSRPKEIHLRENSHGTLSKVTCRGGEEEEEGVRESYSSSAAGEEEESRCFINAIYMTIPVNTEPAGGAQGGGACGSGSSYHQFHSFPPDPNRGALPPPPTAESGGGGAAAGGGGAGAWGGGAFPSFDVISSN